MITLEIKTSLDKTNEQKFLTELLEAIDFAQTKYRLKCDDPTLGKFVRSIGAGVKDGITLEVKTSLDKDEEKRFLTELLYHIDLAENILRLKNKTLCGDKFVRSVGIGTK